LLSEELSISAKTGESDVQVKVDVLGLRAVRLKDRVEDSQLHFDVNAKMEEKDRRSGKRIVAFVLTVGTKPSIAKFEVEGLATLEGKNPDIDKLLEVNPKTRIPLLLNRVYQRVFTSTYLMANLLDTSYPPPDMLSAGDLNARCNNGPVEFNQTEKAPEEKPKDKKKKSKKR
jgi:hypothetical protein